MLSPGALPPEEHLQTIGVDLAKNVFELAISDGRGKITGWKRLTRASSRWQ